MKNKMIILLLVVVMCFCGCNIMQNNKAPQINVDELQNMGYVIYEEENIVKEIETTTFIFTESALEEIMHVDKEKLIPKRTLLVMDNILVKGEAQLDKFINRTEQVQSSITREKEILKIKYAEIEDLAEPYEYILSYQNGEYVYEDLHNGTRQTFNYIVKLKGKSMITGNEEEGYFLSNDKDVTYEYATHKILSSSIESSDYRQLFLVN